MLGDEGKLVMEEENGDFLFKYRNFVLKSFKPPSPSFHVLKILI